MQYLELPEATRLSLLRGYLERSWTKSLPVEHSDACTAEVCDTRAYDDGQRLRVAVDGVTSAVTFADLNVAERVYDDLAAELNERWGDGLVVRSDEAAELGIRGFRAQGFTTASAVLLGESSTAC